MVKPFDDIRQIAFVFSLVGPEEQPFGFEKNHGLALHSITAHTWDSPQSCNFYTDACPGPPHLIDSVNSDLVLHLPL